MEIDETYKAFLGVAWLYLATAHPRSRRCCLTGMRPTCWPTVTADSVFRRLDRTRLGSGFVPVRLR
jgi:hypothetical protein